MRLDTETIKRAVLVRPSASLLEERRRTGADVRDEMWEGVLHMVPPPSGWHQRFASALFRALLPMASAKGLEPLFETGLYRSGSTRPDWRIPDLMFTKPEHFSERGVDGGAELVVEFLSEDDESHEKLEFYAEVGVGEALLIDPVTRETELYALRGGRLHLVLPDEAGMVRLQCLGVSLGKVEGPKLALSWPGGSAQIEDHAVRISSTAAASGSCCGGGGAAASSRSRMRSAGLRRWTASETRPTRTCGARLARCVRAAKAAACSAEAPSARAAQLDVR
ncbi:MAG: Uma2 family endonuclease [Myxococcales bacterium]